MRLIGICLLCLLVIVSYSSLSAAEVGPDNTVRNYFNACQNGDIETLKQIITGPFYKAREVLLNRNPGYSNFLVQHFDAVEINLKSVSILESGRYSEIVVEREYPQGPRLQTRFYLMKDENGIWKIYDEKLVN